MITINFDESPFSEECLLLREDYGDVTMVAEVPEDVYMRSAYYFSNQYMPDLNTHIPIIKQLNAKELKNLFNRIKREKKGLITKEASILVWRIIKDLEGDWDDDLWMTKTKIKKLRETDEAFEARYQEVKRIPVF